MFEVFEYGGQYFLNSCQYQGRKHQECFTHDFEESERIERFVWRNEEKPIAEISNERKNRGIF